MPRKKRIKRGGKVKPSSILGGISGIASAASLTPLAPLAAPVAGLTGLAAGIASLFGSGNLTQTQMRALKRAEARGVKLSHTRRPKPRKKRARKRK